MYQNCIKFITELFQIHSLENNFYYFYNKIIKSFSYKISLEWTDYTFIGFRIFNWMLLCK